MPGMMKPSRITHETHRQLPGFLILIYTKYFMKSTAKKNYAEKLKDPRWQKKRLEILNRDEFTCQLCLDSDSSLHVHHCRYQWGKSPWEYPDSWLMTVCESCHENLSTRPGEFLIGKIKVLNQQRLELDADSIMKHGFDNYVEMLNLFGLEYWRNKGYNKKLAELCDYRGFEYEGFPDDYDHSKYSDSFLRKMDEIDKYVDSLSTQKKSQLLKGVVS